MNKSQKIVLNNKTQTQNHIYCMIPFVGCSQTETKNQIHNDGDENSCVQS